MIEDKDNFDIHEIRKFSAGADIWWDRHGEFRTLHDINPLRIGFITDRVNPGDKHVVDVGCGGGILSEGLAAVAARVTGIDMNEEAIAAARGHNTFANLDYECVSTSRHADQKAASYDVLTCMELLEHVPDPQALVRDCQKLVKPGGHLFFSTINRNLAAYVKLVLAGEYLLNMLPRGTHDYGRFIKPSELARWCRQCGLGIREISGMEYSPLTHGYYLVEQPKTNYLLYAVNTDEHVS